MLKHVRAGDVVLCHSMDRMARNLVDLRKLIDDLTGRGVAVEFVKERLTFTGQDSPMANLLLSVLGGVAEFERATIRERRMEGVAIAKAAGRYRGGVQKLKAEQVEALRARVAVGVPIAKAAREFNISRQSVYTYLKPCETAA
jgi:DNA invertase Pin-like site-specific DNA recombinase